MDTNTDISHLRHTPLLCSYYLLGTSFDGFCAPATSYCRCSDATKERKLQGTQDNAPLVQVNAFGDWTTGTRTCGSFLVRRLDRKAKRLEKRETDTGERQQQGVRKELRSDKQAAEEIRVTAVRCSGAKLACLLCLLGLQTPGSGAPAPGTPSLQRERGARKSRGKEKNPLFSLLPWLPSHRFADGFASCLAETASETKRKESMMKAKRKKVRWTKRACERVDSAKVLK